MNYANIVCPQNMEPTCSANASAALALGVRGMTISFDPLGNVVLGSDGNVVGGGIYFGVGTFPTYGAPNAFLAAYAHRRVERR